MGHPRPDATAAYLQPPIDPQDGHWRNAYGVSLEPLGFSCDAKSFARVYARGIARKSHLLQDRL